MLNIVTINYKLEGDNIVNTSIDGNETLLDADIVIVDPSEFSLMWEPFLSTSTNRATVYTPHSDRVRSVFNSKKREITTLLEKGRIIIVFVCPVTGFNGAREDSHSYGVVTNYDFLPILPQFFVNILTEGKSGSRNSIILSNSKSLFAQYFNAFKDELEYSAYLDTGVHSENFLLNRSSKPVGFSYKLLDGIVVFLPPPRYYSDNEKLLGVLTTCAKRFLTKHEVTPPPDWIAEFKLPGEDTFDKNLTELNQKLEDISSKIQKTELEKSEITKYKALLFEQGEDKLRTERLYRRQVYATWAVGFVSLMTMFVIAYQTYSQVHHNSYNGNNGYYQKEYHCH